MIRRVEEAPLPAFLAGGGEMGARLRALDWSTLGLGPPRSWPVALRSALAICLTSSFPTCVYWGPELRLLYNDAWSHIPAERHPWCLGRPAREVWADIWHVIEPQFAQVIATGRGVSAYDQHLPMERHGRVVETYWTYSLTPLFDEQERVVGILNQGHETTATVLAERAHIDEVARLREMFEQAPSPVALLRGPRHVFEMANTAYLQLVGSRDVIGRPVAEALPEVSEQGFVRLLDQVYASSETYKGEGVHVELRNTAGAPLETHVLDFLYQPLRDATGATTGILVQVTDVTAREHALQQLRQADHRKDVFLATLAHELRNPLAPIRNGLEVLRHGSGSDSRMTRTLEMMERQVRHLVHLVDDLMDVSRISTGKVQLKRQRVRLRDVLTRAVESTDALFAQKHQHLEVSLSESECIIDGDPERLTQVFANLLSNAAKFTPPQGHIALRLTCEGSGAVIDVTDDGVGIPPESLGQVFELFEQVPQAGGHAGGLGIGLALVSQLTHMHGGSVEAASDGPGRGSRFTVRLPLAQAEVSPESPEQADGVAATTRRRRILIADDNADAADSLAALLELQGHEVSVVRDGAAAVEAFGRLRPDVILMDLGMPGLDGIEASRRIRALPGGEVVRIAALTGWGQPSDRERTRTAGFDMHLVKPIDADSLIRAIES